MQFLQSHAEEQIQSKAHSLQVTAQLIQDSAKKAAVPRDPFKAEPFSCHFWTGTSFALHLGN